MKRICKRYSAKAGADIGREVGMLRKLDHPCVVRLHAVYDNTRFVDMVFNCYRGGDMLDAAARHMDSKGQIPMATIQNLTWQMFRGIEWLHSNSIVHRDIKADNFLLDHADVEHPECRVYLSDFGTAIELRPDERLEEHCGTRLYWAPEIYRRSYARKVDVWAAGVTTYTLMAHHFPFGSRDQICKKRFGIPSRCCQVGASFLFWTLERSEVKRLSASDALAHPFLASVESMPHQVGTVDASPQPRSTRAKSSCGADRTASGESEATTAAPDSHHDDGRELQWNVSTVDNLLL